MRILLDTNIFIPLEDSSIDIDEKLMELNRLASGKHQLLIHPATACDIARDKNESRRKKILTRLRKYPEIESPPAFDDGEEEMLFGKANKENDHIDNLILFALHKNCIHWLVTQDEGIHKKARRLAEEERVLTVDQAISALIKLDSEDLTLYPNIQNVACHTLDLSNTFFDSLRDGYEGFDKWFIDKCSKTGRYAWICTEANNIHAICIYNLEEKPILNLDSQGLQGRALKLCTFKVVKRGYKIGELLLKQAFNYVIDNNYDYIFVTVEPGKHELLEDLFIDFGFYPYGTDLKGRDLVYVKEFPQVKPESNDKPLDYAIKYYPYIKIAKNSVYLVPIQPRYHKTLFPELERQQDLFDGINSSAGNAIKQAYLCKSPTSYIRPGDILIFYRTGDLQAITTYGIVDQFHVESDPEKIFQWVSKRTVYSYDEIKNMSSSEVKVVLFRQVKHFKKQISFKRLKDLGIVKGSIQSIIKLNKEKVGILINEANINDCVLSD